MVPEHDYAAQCVRAKAQNERNASAAMVTVRHDETLKEAMARTLREVQAITAHLA